MELALELELPPKGLWVTELALTMLSLLCNGNLRISRNRIVIRESPEAISSRLNEVYNEIRGRRIPINPNDTKILNVILDSFNIHNLPLNASLIEKLVDSLKKFFKNHTAYPNALKPVKPLTQFKAEYKEFMRGFGGYTGDKTVERLLIPPFIQALGLIGLLYTEYYRLPGEGKSIKSIHLTLLEKEFGGEYKIYELYSTVHESLKNLLSPRESQYTTSLIQLVAALSVASNNDAKKVIYSYGDVLSTTTIQGGGRGGYSIVSMEPLAIADVAMLLSRLGLESRSLSLNKLRKRVLSLALAGFGAQCSLAYGFKGSLRFGVDEIRRLRSQISSVLTKYASNIVLYARTGCKDLAYASAREVWALARTEDAQRAFVCTGYCVDRENPKKCSVEEGWTPLPVVLEDLAELASELACMEVLAKPVY